MSSQQTKRTRIDASAASPSDTATTPMASARNSISTYVESLQPEVATILKRLAVEFLVSLHRLFMKQKQVTKLENDDELIPISARVNFTLKCSKLVEQDEEYLSLVSETNEIVKTFQNDLRAKIIATAKLEVTKLKAIAVDTFTKNLRMTVQTLLVCESGIPLDRLDKVINTLFHVYDTKLFGFLDLSLEQMKSTYKRVHSLPNLPPPFMTELPSSQRANAITGTQSTQIPPSTPILNLLSKVWRDIDSIFILPWTQYLHVIDRNAKSLELKSLSEDFFQSKSTDDTEMQVEEEPPVDPQILKDLIRTQVAAETKKLSNEVNRLKTALARHQAKNGPRDPSGASKKLGKQAAGPSNATADAKKKKERQKSKKKSQQSSNKNPSNSKRN